jgi:hypothetical protein
MWQQYRRTLIPTQLFIVAVCVTVYFKATDHQWLPVAVIFLVMQLGALIGAAWATRLKRRLTANDDALPLSRKR